VSLGRARDLVTAPAPGPSAARLATVADVVASLDARYPPELAEGWDAVGLAVGSLRAPVSRLLFTVEVTSQVVAEAVDLGVDLIVAHHPLLLRGVHAVDLDHPKGRLVAELLRQDVAVLVAHTNADVPPDGVVDSLATALGLVDTLPLSPRPDRPDTGLGRVGALTAEVSLGEFADRVAEALPRTGGGVRVSGDLQRRVRKVAVQAGAGDDLLGAARAVGADVYVTSDLRHHPASEARAWVDAPALVDISHWAAESTWLPVVSRLLRHDLAERGLEIPGHVSSVCTDPWTHRV
jgi:dinuclear metal center YbgI/SA1388 family protein